MDYASHSAHVERLQERLLADLAPIRPQASTVAVYSSVTGELFDSESADAAYWFANLRRSVQFQDAVSMAVAAGRRTFLEISPHPVLVTGIQETLETLGATDGERDPASGGGRRATTDRLPGRGLRGRGPGGLVRAVPGRQVTQLPTYAFAHERFWIDTTGARPDLRAAGLKGADHPILVAVTDLPETRGMLLSGSLSVPAQPWLADHRLGEQIVFPGTGFAELALRAGEAVGCHRITELVLHTPLLLPERDSVRIQVA